jgi:uncharacterized protein (DUF1800 family)
MKNKIPLHIRALAAGFLATISLCATASTTEPAATDRDTIVHVLNRITFGPRPGDVETVEKMGLHNYIEQQLHPETIDDGAVDAEIAKYPILQMSDSQIAALYFDEKKAAKVKKAEEASATANTQNTTGETPTKKEAHEAMKDQLGKKAGDAEWRSDAAIEQLEQAKLVRAINSNRQLQEVLTDFWNNHFNVDVKKKQCRVFKVTDDRETIRPHIWGDFRDLLEADAKSPAMLYYLDNASSVASMPGGYDRPMSVTAPDATMQDTAMQAAANPTKGAGQKPKQKNKSKGINENYAREIMELHTLGVDGGYTQKDVQEVARCFTGWTVSKRTGQFEFKADDHDNGPKVVLGHQIPAGGGIKDGETVLDILASSPATAHHISLELCQRFVSDNPPDALVNRVAGVFTKTGGDLRAVTEAILTSPEFLSPSDFNNKIKSPLEFAVSAVRASGSTIVPARFDPRDRKEESREGDAVRGKQRPADAISKAADQSLNWHIYELGEPLFACTPPTGYKEVSTTWVNPGALIERLNFATALTSQKVSDIHFDAKTVIGSADLDKPTDVLDQSAAVLLQNHLTDPTRKVLEQTALPSGPSKTVDPDKLIALLIGSPEFQRK